MWPRLLVLLVFLGLSVPAWAEDAPLYEGKPVIKAGDPNGMVVWKEDQVIKVRFTNKTGDVVYKGTVCARKITALKKVKIEEKEDPVKIGPAGKCIHFEVHTHAGIDGFDFEADGKVIEFSPVARKPTANGKTLKKFSTLPADHIYIGKNGIHPKKSPFELSR